MLAIASPVLPGAVVDLHHISMAGTCMIDASLTPQVFSRLLLSSTYDTFAAPIVGRANAVFASTRSSMAGTWNRMVVDAC